MACHVLISGWLLIVAESSSVCHGVPCANLRSTETVFELMPSLYPCLNVLHCHTRASVCRRVLEYRIECLLRTLGMAGRVRFLSVCVFDDVVVTRSVAVKHTS